MPLRGKVEVKTIELPDALMFTVSREKSTAETIVFPILALIVLVWFFSIGSLWPRILAVSAALFSAVAWIANHKQRRQTTLRVTGDRLAISCANSRQCLLRINPLQSLQICCGSVAALRSQLSGSPIRIRASRSKEIRTPHPEPALTPAAPPNRSADGCRQ